VKEKRENRVGLKAGGKVDLLYKKMTLDEYAKREVMKKTKSNFDFMSAQINDFLDNLFHPFVGM
jgi:hypothetical protein